MAPFDSFHREVTLHHWRDFCLQLSRIDHKTCVNTLSVDGKGVSQEEEYSIDAKAIEEDLSHSLCKSSRTEETLKENDVCASDISLRVERYELGHELLNVHLQICLLPKSISDCGWIFGVHGLGNLQWSGNDSSRFMALGVPKLGVLEPDVMNKRNLIN